jgi:hypothetical protein
MRWRRRRNESPIQQPDQVDLVTEAQDGTFCGEPPDEATGAFLERVRETLSSEGIELRVEVLPPE